MKIYSKFRDYYDHTGFHADLPVWERKTRKFVLDKTKPSDISIEQTRLLLAAFQALPRPRISNSEYNLYLLGFCGRFFPIFQLRIIHHCWYGKKERPKDIIKSFATPPEFSRAYKKATGKSIKQSKHAKLFKRETFDEDGMNQWLNTYRPRLAVDMFIAIKSPIFIVTGGNMTVNPRLLDYNIERILPLVAAHQEIEMYLNNDLVNNFEPMPDFGDNLKRDAHGMDKWSFKQKGPKKRKQK